MSHVSRLLLASTLAISIASPSLAQSGRRGDNATTDQLWSANCLKCHGRDGGGSMPGVPSLLDAKYQDAASVIDIDRSLFDAIKNGKPGGKGVLQMNAFGAALSDEQIWGLVNYIREQQFGALREKGGEGPKIERVGGVEVFKTQHHTYTIETVIDSGVDTPWSVDFLPTGPMLVTTRSGELKMHETGKAGGRLGFALRDVPTVRSRGQGGLMDVAVHPNYAKNGWIYLAFTDPQGPNQQKGMTKIVRGTIKEGAFAEQKTIFQIKPEHYLDGDIHFGCRIVFDPADPTTMFFCMGERGRGELAQDLSRPNGKVYRVKDDGSVPSDNPFVSMGDKAYAAIWSFGHRNPQGLAFDLDGNLWETEHGPRGGDELNLIKPGKNYGWPLISFGINYNGSPLVTPWSDTGKKPAGLFEMPVYRWMPSIAACGLDVMRSPRAAPGASTPSASAEALFPNWRGDLFAGGLAGQTVQRLRIKDGKVIEREEVFAGRGRVRDVVCGLDGSLYIVLNGPDKVVRLVPAPTAPANPAK
jgi:glucose/arabinose dehydrogenase/mono/diheme cytochrome c family protein